MGSERKRTFETKRIMGKGEKKMRTCLGSECNKQIFTTKHTRFCPSCRKQIEKMDDDYGYSICVNSAKGKSK
jgi:hypothetical protein